MKRTLLGLMILALAVAFAISPTHAEDLTSLAKKTREERLKVKQQKSVRIWNNENMPKRPAGEGPTAAAGMSPAPLPDYPGATEPEAPHPPDAEEQPEAPDASAIDALRNQAKQSREKLKGHEGRLRLAEDELSLLQLQQASELSPDTQASVSTKAKDKSAEIAALKLEIEKTKKEFEKLESDLKESGGTLDVKK